MWIGGPPMSARAQTPKFDSTILAIICLNGVVMGCQYFGASYDNNLVVEDANLVFAFIFFFEAVIKVSRSPKMVPF